MHRIDNLLVYIKYKSHEFWIIQYKAKHRKAKGKINLSSNAQLKLKNNNNLPQN